MPETAEAAQPRSLKDAVVAYFRDFKVLKETRSEYWGVQIINFLDCTAYFAMYNIATVFLSEDFKFDDKQAGYIYTLFSSTVTICLFFFGLVTDWLGIRGSMYASMVGLLSTRAAVVFAALSPGLPHRGVVVILALFLMAPFMAMVQTNFQAATKRFTTSTSRSAGFNLWYLFMNIGAAAAGFLIDIIRLGMGLSYAHVFTFGVFTAILCIFVSFAMVRDERQLYSPGEKPPEPSESDNQSKRRNPLQTAVAVVSEPVFWRFLVLVTLLLGVRAVFLYGGLLWPKYWLRVIGPDAAIGTLNAINPILIVIGLIVLIPVLHRFNVYSMLVYGAMISGLSMLAIAIPSFGHATYVTSIIAIVILSVGELIWSPRLYEYTAAIAPKDQEGTYLGLSMVPYFLAKTVVSLLSGHMLARWVPEFPAGEPILRDRLAAGQISFWNSPSALWLILGAFAVGGPVVAWLLKGWFTKGAKWTTKAPTAPAAAQRLCPNEQCRFENQPDAQRCVRCGAELPKAAPA